MKKIGYILLSISLLFAVSCGTENMDEIHETIYVRHEGADMPAYVHGNSESKTFLVVLHGAGSFGLAFRDGGFTAELEEKYVVVYFDQRGQSMSQGHYSKPDELIDLMAADVEALTQVLKHKYGEDISLFLMGHSWGGLLSAATLLRPGHQAAYKGWINVSGLMNVPAASLARQELIDYIAREQMDLGTSVEAWREIRGEIEVLDPDKDYDAILGVAAKCVKQLLADGTVPATLSSEKLYRALLDNNPITWQISHLFNQPVEFAIDANYSVQDRMSEITIPALFIYGKFDVSVPYFLGVNSFIEMLGDERKFVRFDSSMHHPHDTEPVFFVEEVEGFMESYR